MFTTTVSSSSGSAELNGSTTMVRSDVPAALMTFTTVPSATPRKYEPPRPEVMTVSPTFTSVEVSRSSKYRRPAMEPRTTPSARFDCSTTETPDCGSEIKRTRHVSGETSITWPTKPLPPITGRPHSTPEAEPTLSVTTRFQASVPLPITRPVTPEKSYLSDRSSKPCSR